MEKTINIQGVDVRYDVVGDGPRAVLVMHGWGCKASTVKVLTDACTDASTTVYTLDLPGFGASSEPAEVWGMEEYTAFLEEFVRKTRI